MFKKLCLLSFCVLAMNVVHADDKANDRESISLSAEESNRFEARKNVLEEKAVKAAKAWASIKTSMEEKEYKRHLMHLRAEAAKAKQKVLKKEREQKTTLKKAGKKAEKLAKNAAQKAKDIASKAQEKASKVAKKAVKEGKKVLKKAKDKVSKIKDKLDRKQSKSRKHTKERRK